jgi:hypothetical protein
MSTIKHDDKHKHDDKRDATAAPEAQAVDTITPHSINEPPGSDITPDDEQPVISSLEPNSCMVGDPDFTLVVHGTGFSSQSVISFAGHDEPTTLNEDGTLSTGVQPSLWTDPVVVQCQIKNGQAISAPVDFTFSAAGQRAADPDELEDEIDQAEDDGDVVHHHGKRKTKR